MLLFPPDMALLCVGGNSETENQSFPNKQEKDSEL